MTGGFLKAPVEILVDGGVEGGLEGAPFTADDDRNASRVAVIGEGARRRFFGDEAAKGRSIELDGVQFRVIGVVRDTPWYRINSAADIWVPLQTQTSAGFFDR